MGHPFGRSLNRRPPANATIALVVAVGAFKMSAYASSTAFRAGLLEDNGLQVHQKNQGALVLGVHPLSCPNDFGQG